MTSEKKVGYHPGGSVPRRSRTTSRRRPTGRTVYKSKTTIPTIRTRNVNSTPKRVAKPTTQTPRQKAIAAVKARSAAKRAAILKQFNSLTPAQKTAMKQKQQAKALSFKQRQGTNQATPTKTTGTLGKPSKPTTLGAAMARFNSQSSRRAAMARRRAAAMARRTNAKLGRPTGRTLAAGKFKKTPGAAIPKKSTASSGKRSRDYSLGRRRFT